VVAPVDPNVTLDATVDTTVLVTVTVAPAEPYRGVCSSLGGVRLSLDDALLSTIVWLGLFSIEQRFAMRRNMCVDGT